MEIARGARADLFDPASLAALGRIEIVSRWIVDGFMSGLHRSPRKGFSVEFADYRPYQPGDDLRYIDWKIAARSDRWVVRQYEEETNLRASVVLDVSRSMAWSGAQMRVGQEAVPTDRLTKLAYAERLTAALALLLLRQRDAVGLVRFDDRIRSAVPPRARKGQWRRVIAALEEPGTGKASSAPEALAQAARLINRRGLIVLISDLLMDLPDVERSMRALRAGGHDITVLHVMDPAERDLPSSGEALFIDPESDLTVPASVADVRAAYRNTVEEVIGEWRAMFGSLGIGYEVISTDAPFGVPLRRAFAARQQLPVSFLAPLYLVLGAAVAVPLIIHLMRRRVGVRVDFPAARYLARAEKEHSRTLRMRNLLLMLLRVLALVAIAAAAARPVANWVGAGHAPTAIAIVVDNSLSSSMVVDGRPLLDQFKGMARDVVGASTSADRLWLVTIDGRVRGGSAAALRDDINRLEPLAGRGDPAGVLARAAGIVRSAGLAARQVALVTDGQRTEWEHAPAIAGVPLVLYAPQVAAPTNRAVVLAEARPVRWTPRGSVAARFLSRDSTTYRITLNGRTFARGTAAPNEEVVVRAAPPERGWVDGTVELEPDELAGDNVRHFAVWVGPAPGLAVSPAAGPFVKNAIDVLRTTERVTDGHDIAVVPADEVSSLPALIFAPLDPVRLGAANRALERAGIPWRFGARRTGDASVRGAELDGVTTVSRYDLVAQSGAVAETLAVVGRDAWIVAGPRYVLVGSPITPDATNLPIRAGFVPWLGNVLTTRLVGEPGQVIDAAPGEQLPRPRWADGVERSDGQRVALTEDVEAPTRSGVLFLTRGGRRVGAVVVNAPAEESVLDRYPSDELRDHIRSDRTLAAPNPSSWSTMAFRAAARRSLLEPALIAALVLLIAEAVAIGARSGRVA